MAIVAMPEQIKAVNYSLVDIFTQDTREKKNGVSMQEQVREGLCSHAVPSGFMWLKLLPCTAAYRLIEIGKHAATD